MPWWVPLVAGLLTGSFALGGVALTQHSTRQQERAKRLDERRLEQRDVLVDLIDAIEHWAPQAEIASLFFGKATESDLSEYVDTDSGKALRESARTVERVLVRCRLIVNDEELRPLIVKVADAVRRLPDDINGPILDAAREGRDPMQAVLASVRYYREVSKLAVSIQDAALRRLASGEQSGP